MYNYLCVILVVISIISPIFTESIVKGNKENNLIEFNKPGRPTHTFPLELDKSQVSSQEVALLT